MKINLIRYIIFLFKTKIVNSDLKEIKYKNNYSYIVNKPKTNSDAFKMLSELSNKSHQVITT